MLSLKVSRHSSLFVGVLAALMAVSCTEQRTAPNVEGMGGTAGLEGMGGTGGGPEADAEAPLGGESGEDAGLPLDPDAGTEETCVLTEKKCQDDKVLECQSAGWVEVDTCDRICEGGICTGECKPNVEKKCSADGKGLQTCSADGKAFLPPEPCEGHCLGNACVACKPNSPKCNGNQPQVCSAAGQWENAGSACETGCNAQNGLCFGCPETGKKTCTGKRLMVCSANKEWVEEKTCAAGEGCVQDKCTPCEPGVSQPKCQSDKVLECGADGQWKEKQNCTNLKVSCHAGECGNCKVGDRSCSGKVPQLCGSDAQWKAEPACPVFCSNKDGKCHDCVPDAAGTAPKCDPTGKFLRSCNDSGDFVSGMTCSAKGCVVGRTKCSDCTPNTDTQCVPISGGARGETCNASGEWSNPQMCTGGQGCIAGTCKACQPGVSANVCRNNKVETCDSTGAWVVLDNCDTKGVTCANATCGQCMKDATGCDGKVPQVCGADGTWVKKPACSIYCSPSDATCGDCVPTSTAVCVSGALKTCSNAGKYVAVTPACEHGCQEAATSCYKCPLNQQTCNAAGTAVVKCNGNDYSTVVQNCTNSTPANANTICVGSSCSWACKDDFKQCGTKCVPDGGCCENSDCTAGPNAVCNQTKNRCEYVYRLPFTTAQSGRMLLDIQGDYLSSGAQLGCGGNDFFPGVARMFLTFDLTPIPSQRTAVAAKLWLKDIYPSIYEGFEQFLGPFVFDSLSFGTLPSPGYSASGYSAYALQQTPYASAGFNIKSTFPGSQMTGGQTVTLTVDVTAAVADDLVFRATRSNKSQFRCSHADEQLGENSGGDGISFGAEVDPSQALLEVTVVPY